ncbi:MAG TPA: NUDIX domain-containing protein [Candidatus Limnocylindria bacterium]|nr:NUDIX domain-containing protein [Candidatus Limnocylindria bacterium]
MSHVPTLINNEVVITMKRLRATESKVYSLVQTIAPLDQLERQHIADVLSWIKSGTNIYRIEKPDKPPKHLVSYFVLIDPDHDSLLLADHVKAQLWLPSGGHVEPNEDPKDTVTREAEEELGQQAVFLRNNDKPLFVTVTQTVGLTPGHTDVSLWYLVRGSIHDHINFNRREFNDVAWFTFKEILESSPVIFDPHMQRFTQKLITWLQPQKPDPH